ncbi:MAG TPA: NAD(P)H-binding protein, partial [Polyangiaceae bacterium]|nr:NAD(P)H-binding protein [Polyangiaceae bacterium]
MRVFLTGGTGFVGSHVIPALLAGGHAVRALRRRPAPDASVTAGLEWVTGDVLDPRSLADAAAGCEVAIHAAAELSFRRADQRRQ